MSRLLAVLFVVGLSVLAVCASSDGNGFIPEASIPGWVGSYETNGLPFHPYRAVDTDPTHGEVKELPGYGPVKEKQYAGYFPVDNSSMNYLYFWMFESQTQTEVNTDIPVVIWLQGGPGGSSLAGGFFELGPYQIDSDSLELKDNPYSWNQFSHLLLIDQPVGTGFSYTLNGKYCHDEDCVAKDLYTFLQNFYRAYPQYKGCDLFLTGESYAGKYIPATASYIIHMNEHSHEPAIPLKGCGIGDGWTEPGTQTIGTADFALANGLIGPIEYPSLKQKAEECAKKVDSGDYIAAQTLGEAVLNDVLKSAGSPNMYDIRSYVNYDMSFIGKYLAKTDVHKILYANSNWGEQAQNVAEALNDDIYSPILDKMPGVLEHISVLIYNGQFDLICNLKGVEDMYYNLKWSGAEQFKNAKREIWKTGSDVSGFARSGGNLTQVVMVGGGHLYPYNQPKFALDMLSRLVFGKPL